MSWALFVEGDWDEVFVRWLLEFLDVEDIQVHAIGGWSLEAAPRCE